MLLNRLFWPPLDSPPFCAVVTCGVRLRKSVKLRFSVGSRRSAVSEMSVCTPRRDEEIWLLSVSDVARTVTTESCAACVFSLKLARKFCPSERRTPVMLSGANPSRLTEMT